MKNLLPARVALPGATAEEGEAISFVQTLLGEAVAHERHLRRQQTGMARAMVALGKPVFRGVAKPATRPNKRTRYAATMKARSGYLARMARPATFAVDGNGVAERIAS